MQGTHQRRRREASETISDLAALRDAHRTIEEKDGLIEILVQVGDAMAKQLGRRSYGHRMIWQTVRDDAVTKLARGT